MFHRINFFARGLFALGLCAVCGVASATTIAHWTFEDAPAGNVAGAVSDSSGNGHHGTAFGGPVYAGVPGGGTGLQFDGSNDRVFVTDSSDFISNSLTVEAIVLLDALPGGSALDQIVFRGDNRAGADPFYLGILGTKLRFYIEGPGAPPTALHSVDDLPVGQLIHLAGTIDDSTGAMRLYVNGSLVASSTTTVRPTLPLLAAWSPGIGIGNLQSSGNQYLDGLIDEIRISDVALTPDQFLGAVVAAPAPDTLALSALSLLMMAAACSQRVAKRYPG